jgi:RNA polymerase-binding transcription factor DksA
MKKKRRAKATKKTVKKSSGKSRSGAKKAKKAGAKKAGKAKKAKKTQPAKKVKPTKKMKATKTNKTSKSTKKASSTKKIQKTRAAKKTDKKSPGASKKTAPKKSLKKSPEKESRTKTMVRSTPSSVDTKVPQAPTVPAKLKTHKLSPSVRKSYRVLLMNKRARILGDLAKMESGALRASGQDPSVDNMADHGTDNYEQDFTLGLMENVEGVVQEIDHALARLDDKTFGVCEECGCVIPKPRLQAIPYTRYCVACQSEMEKF